jgi:hypothetical protein
MAGVGPRQLIEKTTKLQDNDLYFWLRKEKSAKRLTPGPDLTLHCPIIETQVYESGMGF